jgi:hypothetical protein
MLIFIETSYKKVGNQLISIYKLDNKKMKIVIYQSFGSLITSELKTDTYKIFRLK